MLTDGLRVGRINAVVSEQVGLEHIAAIALRPSAQTKHRLQRMVFEVRLRFGQRLLSELLAERVVLSDELLGWNRQIRQRQNAAQPPLVGSRASKFDAEEAARVARAHFANMQICSRNDGSIARALLVAAASP